MASHFRLSSRASPRAARTPTPVTRTTIFSLPVFTRGARARVLRRSRVGVSGGDSYLEMWTNARERERKAAEFEKIAGKTVATDMDDVSGEAFDVERKSEAFEKMLQVPKEERDRIQRMQVIDRAAAAISAARAVLEDKSSGDGGGSGGEGVEVQPRESENGVIFLPHSGSSRKRVPGPDFWSWAPPESDRDSDNAGGSLEAKKLPASSPFPVAFKEPSVGFLSIPLQSKVSDANHNPPVVPKQSFKEVEKTDISESAQEAPPVTEEDHELGILFSEHAAEAAHALYGDDADQAPSYGVTADGSRWWKQTGIKQRPDGVTCRWTMIRGVSADQEVEWQDKFWEAANEFGYKELGSEKSGRDATGSVWREYWTETMWQDCGLLHMEKTADKWGRNGKGDEWHEKWFEHHDASNKAEKWAHKWCSIDPTAELEAGHAHVWHERWGENYDGHGGSMKYTDKWAERCEGDGWTKWGDKWDENFDPNGHGVKQGETWWEGKHGERWNRTWGEGHNGSGWIHKYGKSSCGEHWDTHVQQETWYERFPHFGFYHCFDNSVQLREVKRPSEFDDVLVYFQLSSPVDCRNKTSV